VSDALEATAQLCDGAAAELEQAREHASRSEPQV
jgi:hypothetical protein